MCWGRGGKGWVGERRGLESLGGVWMGILDCVEAFWDWLSLLRFFGAAWALMNLLILF